MKTLASMTRVLGLSAAAAAAFAIQPVAAQTVSNNGQGSAVVVPYYTINNGWATLVNLTNTTDNSIVVKFRLHEARNSRDVLDFNIALSPYDVWSAFVTEGPGNAPRLVTEDRSCTIPDIRDSGASATLRRSGVSGGRGAAVRRSTRALPADVGARGGGWAATAGRRRRWTVAAAFAGRRWWP